ncbi:MAG: hypothetical protein ACP5F1_06560 [Thermoplasmata archaeon]
MDFLILENNTISEGEKLIGTINIEKKSINIQGSVNISIKKERGYYSIFEDNLPLGRVERDLKIIYQGKEYEPQRKDLYNFISGKTNKIDIYFFGSISGTIERENHKLVVKSDNAIEKTPFIIYLAIFSRYKIPVRRSQALKSPYREIYYGLLALFFIVFILMNIFYQDEGLYSLFALSIIIAEFAVYIIGRRKMSQ